MTSTLHPTPPAGNDPSNLEAVPVEPRRQAAHVGYLDGLRAVAALLVVLHHSWLTIWPIFTTPKTTLPTGWTLKLTYWLVIAGPLSVDVFIVLSGYCLFMPVVRRDSLTLTLAGGSRRFYAKRALRILPTYYAALALSLLLDATCLSAKTGTHWDSSLPVTRDAIIGHVLLIQHVYGSSSAINHALWTIAVEWWIYLLFPLLLLCWRRLGAPGTTLAALAGSFALQSLLSRLGYSSAHTYFVGLFALGMLAADIVYAAPGSRRAFLRGKFPWIPVWGITTICLCVALDRIGMGAVTKHIAIVDIFWGVWAALLLVSLASSARFAAPLNGRPLVWVGTFAYSLYLIHAPLVQIFWQAVLEGRHRPARDAFIVQSAAIPLIVACSWVFYLVAERPIVRRLAASRSAPR